MVDPLYYSYVIKAARDARKYVIHFIKYWKLQEVPRKEILFGARLTHSPDQITFKEVYVSVRPSKPGIFFGININLFL